jgi:hypothetical protein
VSFSNLPVPAQHLLVALVGVLLSWGASDFVPLLEGRSPLAAGLVGALLTVLAGWLAPFVREYGIGSGRRDRA